MTADVLRDLEGRIHLLDYDKKFLVKSYDNLTFDGLSIQELPRSTRATCAWVLDWSAFYMVPADVFGTGKALVFGTVIDKGGEPYSGDMRGVLKDYSDKLYKEKGWTLNAANEIEGFLFKARDAERTYHETGKFEFVNTGGHRLAAGSIRCASSSTPPLEVQRAMGFGRPKRRTTFEVAPSQFEINYGYGEVVAAADQIQLYKLLCRQVAGNMGYTASFLPKPVVGVNGSGMHTNMSISEALNLFWDEKDRRSCRSWAGSISTAS